MNIRSSNTVAKEDVSIPRRKWPLVAEFLDSLRSTGLSESCLRNFPGPVKHFIVWLDINNIKISKIDVHIVRRFLTHNCDCPRPAGEHYQSRHMRKPNFISTTFRFVRFLEQTGRIPSKFSLIEGMSRVEDYVQALAEQDYAFSTIRSQKFRCRHFITWLNQEQIPLAAIDEAVIERFAIHDCHCPGGFTSKGRLSRGYLQNINRFRRFLVNNGVVQCTSTNNNVGSDEFKHFRDWLRRNRGIKEISIHGHVSRIKCLRPQLSTNPELYTAKLINNVLLDKLNSGTVSRNGAQQMCGSLRMYLRFLASRGACPAALVDAVPRIPQWRLATLPRYILADDVERVISSCDVTTPRGLRDRAILLLLARLALRAGDVVGLTFEDIDWENALVTVAGKTKHAVALPLPQDVGDALILYIENARPKAISSQIFIRTIAPFVPLASIGTIVRDALKRARIENANLKGAYLLRHSAATNMLRSGSTLNEIGALMRHRSHDTTAIYAKVDTTMLMQVAQPWIGETS